MKGDDANENVLLIVRENNLTLLLRMLLVFLRVDVDDDEAEEEADTVSDLSSIEYR